jgi:hypothetical protein
MAFEIAFWNIIGLKNGAFGLEKCMYRNSLW